MRPSAAALYAVVILWCSPARATEVATEPDVHPTLPWLATQLVPSPQWIFGDKGAHFGLRWQVTPVLYSFGMKHTGFRYGVDAAWMKKAFTGYVLEYHGLTVYFGGDTSYEAAHFAATRKRFPTIDLAILPVGPIRPRAVMRSTHVDPGEAVQAFLDLGAKVMVPMHYGTFASGAEDTAETLALLRAAAAEKQLAAGALAVMEIGEERVFVARQ